MEIPKTPSAAIDWQENSKIAELLQALFDKYAATGQDLSGYLEGLLYADYLSYWDYIHLDTLLSLQTPRTGFPDENIFIMYHQITELYFKMILAEMEQISFSAQLTDKEMQLRVGRANRYIEILTHSFRVMYDGMDQEQFLKFRMALLPASGFQSVQFRMIEIAATDLEYLLSPEGKLLDKADLEGRLAHIYWLQGATELATGRKTYTLVQFEKKYHKTMLDFIKRYESCNLRAKMLELMQKGELSQETIQYLKELDVLVNVTWRLMHLRSAVQYLHKEPEVIAATGGTNWQQYLPPKFQKRCFFPELWSEDEMQEWGKDWVMEMLKKVRRPE